MSSLHDYLEHFHREIEKLANFGFVESTVIKEETRPLKQAVLTGKLIFLNGSELHIKEYIDAEYKLEKISYAYHYQDVHGSCLFRYDNAAHKPNLGFKEHKHQKDGSITKTPLPDITDILDEIVKYL